MPKTQLINFRELQSLRDKCASREYADDNDGIPIFLDLAELEIKDCIPEFDIFQIKEGTKIIYLKDIDTEYSYSKIKIK